MSEAGGPVFEGVGRPEARSVRGVKDRLMQWLKRTFTMEGREEVQREKLVKNLEKISSQMSPEQKQAAADLLEKNINTLAHKNAVGSIWRDAIITSVAVPLIGVGVWKRKDIGNAISTTFTNVERHLDTAKNTFSGIIKETKGKPRERLSQIWAAIRRGGLSFDKS